LIKNSRLATECAGGLNPYAREKFSDLSKAAQIEGDY